jgi:hypothetical protein
MKFNNTRIPGRPTPARGLCRLLGLWALLCGTAGAQPVAGLQPDQRPEGAPVVRVHAVDATLKQQRLKGVTTPWPGTVERIAESGAWYSPMFHPGMPSRYDLRQLHASDPPR